jgi:hypothetical protein
MVLVVLLPWYCAPGELFGGAGDNTPQRTPEPPAPFVLTVQDGLLSLRAQAASLKVILETLGQRLDIEVVAKISPEERVTMAFDHLSLEDTLKRFRAYASIVYLIKEAEKASGTISKILVFPKQAGSPSAGPSTHAADSEAGEPAETSDRRGHDEGSRDESRRPRPFTFQLDPLHVMESRQ